MNERFERIDGQMERGVYLYGAGRNGDWVYDYCCRTGIRVIAFIDSDPNKIGQAVDGLPCISYEEYAKSGEQRNVLITAKHYMWEILEEHKDNPYLIPFDAWFAAKNESKYRSLVFEDKKSYETLEAILTLMSTGAREKLWTVSEQDQYFSVAPFWGNLNETFVDLGAFTGDTIERFLFAHVGSFDKIYAFEPAQKQNAALQKRLERLEAEWLLAKDDIVIESMCVGATDCEVFFDTSGDVLASHVSDKCGTRVQQVSLDTYFRDKKVTYIKTDIEGADYDVIKGGEQLIRRCRPKLAVSIYHNPDDLFRVYEFVDRLDMGYRFKLRHHSNMMVETVLYCY